MSSTGSSAHRASALIGQLPLESLATAGYAQRFVLHSTGQINDGLNASGILPDILLSWRNIAAIRVVTYVSPLVDVAGDLIVDDVCPTTEIADVVNIDGTGIGCGVADTNDIPTVRSVVRRNQTVNVDVTTAAAQEADICSAVRFNLRAVKINALNRRTRAVIQKVDDGEPSGTWVRERTTKKVQGSYANGN